jgi:DNA repair exonuclease SbcCD ATPase subunit
MVAVAVFGAAGVAALALGSPVVGAVLLVAALAAAAATFWFLRPVPTGEATQSTVTPRVDAGAARRQRLEEHAARVEATERALAEMLTSHQVTLSEGETLEQGVERYKAECAAREEQDQAARQRERITVDLQQRRGAEQRQAVRKAAGDGVLAAAAAAGLSETDPGAAAAALQAWKAEHQSDLEGQDVATREWAQLEEVLGGEAVESLLESAREARAVADERAVRFSADELDSLTAEDAAAKLPGLRAAHGKALDEAARQEQVAETEARSLHSPAEALAELDEAKDAFGRVEELDETLDTTITFLQAAQERVYATIAPALTATVREWLPEVVVVIDGGAPAPRYSDVRVDPETLQVELHEADGEPWRDADLLSAGTREQVYLLLRVALAEHLVKSGEIAPLLLDEVTAQADSTRRGALLELILELSRNRQIILFTHDDAVAAWAQQRLEPNAVRRLEPISRSRLVGRPLTA